jgi:myosin heavy subunit
LLLFENNIYSNASRFEKLARSYGLSLDNSNPRDICLQILQNSALRNFRLGASTVFIKSDDLDALERTQKACVNRESATGLKATGSTASKKGVQNVNINDAQTPYQKSMVPKIDANKNVNIDFNTVKTTPHLRNNAKGKQAGKEPKCNQELDPM